MNFDSSDAIHAQALLRGQARSNNIDSDDDTPLRTEVRRGLLKSPPPEALPGQPASSRFYLEYERT